MKESIILFLILGTINILCSMSWTVQRMTNNVVSNSTPSLAVDPNGEVHIAYDEGDLGSKDLRYLTNRTGVWVDTLLASGSSDEWLPSIAVDRNGKVHIVYIYGLGGYLWYATNKSGNWVLNQIPISTGQEFFPSLAVDNNGYAHVAYQIGIGNGIGYATNRSGNWQVEWNISQGFTPALCLDGRGKVHIAYERSNQLYHVSNETGNWVETYVTGGGARNNRPSIKCDQNNKSHIAWQKQVEPPYILCYATNVSGSWTWVPLDSSMRLSSDPSIAVDRTNIVHIVYTRVPGPEIYYITNKTGSWKKYPITNNSYWDEIIHKGVFDIDKMDVGHVTFYGMPEGSSEIYYARSDSQVVGIDEWVIKSQPGEVIIISPNPAVRQTGVKLNVREKTRIKLAIFDITGERIETLYDGFVERPIYLSWPTDNQYSSGIYFIKATIGNRFFNHKIILVK